MYSQGIQGLTGELGVHQPQVLVGRVTQAMAAMVAVAAMWGLLALREQRALAVSIITRVAVAVLQAKPLS